MWEFVQHYEGIVGALLGVVTATLLNEFIKYKGRIKFYKENSQVSYYITDSRNGQALEVNKDIDFEGVKFEYEIEIYNASESKKALRDISIILVSENVEKCSRTGYLEERNYNEFRRINLQPREMHSFKLFSYINISSQEFQNSNKKKIYFVARDDKNRKVKILLYKF